MDNDIGNILLILLVVCVILGFIFFVMYSSSMSINEIRLHQVHNHAKNLHSEAIAAVGNSIVRECMRDKICMRQRFNQFIDEYDAHVKRWLHILNQEMKQVTDPIKVLEQRLVDIVITTREGFDIQKNILNPVGNWFKGAGETINKSIIQPLGKSAQHMSVGQKIGTVATGAIAGIATVGAVAAGFLTKNPSLEKESGEIGEDIAKSIGKEDIGNIMEETGMAKPTENKHILKLEQQGKITHNDTLVYEHIGEGDGQGDRFIHGSKFEGTHQNNIEPSYESHLSYQNLSGGLADEDQLVNKETGKMVSGPLEGMETRGIRHPLRQARAMDQGELEGDPLKLLKAEGAKNPKAALEHVRNAETIEYPHTTGEKNQVEMGKNYWELGRSESPFTYSAGSPIFERK